MPETPQIDEQGRERVRVKDVGTGHEYSELKFVVDNNAEAYEVLDQDAVDAAGRILDVRYAGSPADEDEGYAAHTVAELKDEIARRNEGRDEQDQIPAQGNKPDLIEALEADDNKEN